jgi:hypothetical protein
MFETKDEVKVAVDALMSLANHIDRGQCMTWNQIESITGDRRGNRAQYVIRKFMRRLERDREIVTLAAHNVGLRFLTDEELATEIPAIRQRKAYRQVRRAIKQTALVNHARLPVSVRKLLAAQRANMAIQRRELFRSRKQLATGRITETAPRRAIPA